MSDALKCVRKGGGIAHKRTCLSKVKEVGREGCPSSPAEERRVLLCRNPGTVFDNHKERTGGVAFTFGITGKGA